MPALRVLRCCCSWVPPSLSSPLVFSPARELPAAKFFPHEFAPPPSASLITAPALAVPSLQPSSAISANNTDLEAPSICAQGHSCWLHWPQLNYRRRRGKCWIELGPDSGRAFGLKGFQ